MIDNGINFSHPALNGKQWNNINEIPNNGLDDDTNGYIDDVTGWDYINNDSLPEAIPDGKDNNENGQIDESLWHGTFIAGLISGDDTSTGFIGVAPNCKIMTLRVLDSDASFNSSMWDSILDAIDYAIDNGANVVSFSIKFNNFPPSTFYDALKRCELANVPFIGVAGNDGDEISFPGRYDEVICVGATTIASTRASFSNFGPELDLVAPGRYITSCKHDGTYHIGSGTSYAVPLVSGTIALMLSINSSLSYEDVDTILKDTVNDIGPTGRDDEYGYGLLDTENAIRKVKGLPLRNENAETNSTILYLLIVITTLSLCAITLIFSRRKN